MKTNPTVGLILCTLVFGGFSAGVWAEAPKMKMTTEVPPGIATPDRLETRLGTLNLFDGVPDNGLVPNILNSSQAHNFDFMQESILRVLKTLGRPQDQCARKI